MILTHDRRARQPELHASLCPHYDRCSAAYCPAAGGRHLKGEPVCALLREAVKNGPGAVLSDRIPSLLAERVLEVAARILSTPCGLRWELRRAARHASQRSQAERLNPRDARLAPISVLVHEARRVQL